MLLVLSSLVFVSVDRQNAFFSHFVLVGGVAASGWGLGGGGWPAPFASVDRGVVEVVAIAKYCRL